MKYDFVYTFVVPRLELPFYDDGSYISSELASNNIKHKIFATSKGYRVITYGSTRRKVEDIMYDLEGRHLRILDGFTYEIMCDLIESRKEVKL